MEKITNEMTWQEQQKIIKEIKEEFIETIDLEPLYNEIKKVIGDNSINFKSNIRENYGEKWIEIESDNLLDKIGVMNLVFKSIHLETFNSSIVYKKDTNEIYWWGTIDFRYHNFHGGYNGVELLRFEFKNGKYTFFMANEGE